jgi:hypothetical protein
MTTLPSLLLLLLMRMPRKIATQVETQAME